MKSLRVEPQIASVTSASASTAEDPNGPISRRTFFLLLGILFSVHVGLRLYISPIVNLDESWQVVLSQHWALGYHSHPPLYTWLQKSVFSILGESIFSLSLLKNGLIFALYAMVYFS